MDKLREDTRERTWEDYVETASAALAIGAGAALFLRSGGARTLTKAATFLDSYRTSIAKEFLENPITSFASLEGTLRNNFGNATRAALNSYEGRLGELESPLRSGVIGDVWSAIRRSVSNVTNDTILNDVLTANRQKIAQNTIARIHEFASQYDKNMLLDESTYAAVERLGDKMARANKGMTREDTLSFLSEVTTDEDVWEVASKYADAVREELARNEKPLNVPDNWIFTERGIKGFEDDGTVIFGETVKTSEVMQDAIANAKRSLDTDYQSIVEDQQANKNFFTNFIDSVMGRRATMGELMDAADRGDQSALMFFGPDNVWPAALSESLENKAAASQLANPLEELRKARRGMESIDREWFDRIELDSIRIQEGQFYGTKAINDAKRSLLENIGNTLPGRIFRLNDMLYNENLPTTKYFAAGTLDSTLANALHPEVGHIGISTATGEFVEDIIKPFGPYTDRDILWHRGRSYAVNANGTLEEIKELRNYTLQSSRIGSQAEIFRAINKLSNGKDPRDLNIDGVSLTVKRALREFGNNLEFFTDAMLTPEGRTSLFTQQSLIHINDFGGQRSINMIDRFINTMDRYISADSLDHKAYRRLNKWYQGSAYKSNVKDSTITGILQTLEDISGPDKEKALMKFMGRPGSLDTPQQFMNPKLQRLFSDFWKDPARTMKQGMVHADQYKLKDATAYVIEKFPDNVRKELTKELFLQMADVEQIGVKGINEMISRNLHGERAKNIRNLAGYSLFEQMIGRGSVGKRKKDIAMDFLASLSEISQNPNDETNRIVFDAFADVRKRFNFEKEAARLAPTGEVIRSVGDYHYVHKAYSFKEQAAKAMDMITNANAYYYDKDLKRFEYDPISAGSVYARDLKNATRELFKPITQFFSGRDAFDAYSTLSHPGYHIMSRVNEQLKWTKRIFGHDITLDLRLKQEHAGSAAAIMSNLVLRRVAPIAIGYNALDWLDDATRFTTGMGIAEAGLSGLANSYLGIKRITGAVGLDSSLKSLSSDNPIMQYWSGITGEENSEWNTYEEQKDYYERGYTAIRKNRGWWFGSSNEIRGNKIAYFEPNTLRMMHSNYYMESMYQGSMWKKWSHSLMPTPTNPLSPLFYIMDPYYLENMHKEDRPYPVTGSTFAENTPWGIALNPFFDTFIKPKKQMYRNRLGEDGIDVKALVAHVNEDIKRRSLTRQDDNIIYLQNGKLRSMLFTAFNAPTPSQRIVSSMGDSVTMTTDFGTYGSGVGGEEFSSLVDNYGNALGTGPDTGQGITDRVPIEDNKLISGQPVNTDSLTIADRLVLSAGKGNPIASTLVSSMKQTGIFDSIRGANMSIRQRGDLRKDQGFFYENKLQYEHTSLDDLLANSETISDLMTQGKGSDYMHEMEVATRNITGLYGYLANISVGFGENNQKRIATSQNMESFSRQFWDTSIGGLDIPGSDVMEIGRRFIPNYQRQAMVNPLMNNMPDWLPERLRFGDPFASIPKGEARLPGRGYESLNQLHPDIYGKYGAFDRFKILADVAPYSPEYKFWKKVAGATIKDPELKKEIQEIKDRVAEQTSGHDFYDYKYIGRGMDKRTATVTEVLNNGKFKIDGSNQIYKLSGVSIKAGPNGESTQDVLSKYIYAGQEITLAVDENINYARNNDKDHTINAGVLVDGENIAERMLEAGEARRRKGDTSAPSYMLKHGDVVNALNTISEGIGHLDTPVWHSRALRIDSPLESYKDDYIYGVSYQSWADPLKTFLAPNFKKFASSPAWVAIGIGVEIVNNNIQNRGNAPQMLRSLAEGYLGREIEIGTGKRFMSNLAAYTLNRGQLTGELLGKILFMGASKELQIIDKFKDFGSMAALGYAAFANPDNLAVSTMSWSRLGWKAAELIENEAKGKAALAGAAIGVVRWLGAQKLLASADNANTYIPDETKERWDMQEYFDRLTYIKYMGLYEQAADKAMSEEGVNVRKIMDVQAKDREERFKMKETLKEQLLSMDRNDVEAEEARKLINRKLREPAPKIGIRGGEWTKTAIMYRNVAEATMYGLSENAVVEDIVRALPKTERDYFIEFMKEKDPDKRQEILSTVSPMLNRALHTIWKMPLPEKVSNEEYFEHHTLPAPTWSGWRPDVDLANVEAKVIYNQGMKYSDMGIYASQYRTPEVQNAPNIDYDISQNSKLLTRLKLQMAITGTGIDADKISVEPSPDSTIQIVTNLARIIPYKVNYEVENFLNKI